MIFFIAGATSQVASEVIVDDDSNDVPFDRRDDDDDDEVNAASEGATEGKYGLWRLEGAPAMSRRRWKSSASNASACVGSVVSK